MALFGKKKKGLELDLPPPPPPLDMPGKKEEKMDEMFVPPPPEIEEIHSKGTETMGLPPPPPAPEDLPEIPSVEEQELPKLEEADMPPLPDVKDIEKDLPPISELEELQEELPHIERVGKEDMTHMQFPHVEEGKEIPAGPIKETKLPSVKPKLREGPVFVNVNVYKDIIHNVNSIKRKVKENDNTLARLNEIKNLKDKYFEQFRAKLEDMQRKNAYVDKNLFKGGKLNE